MKEFNKDKRYVFSKVLFLMSVSSVEDDEDAEMNRCTRSWIYECDNQEVKVLNAEDATFNGYLMSPKWCKEIKEEPK